MKKDKRQTYARELFSSVDWLPQHFSELREKPKKVEEMSKGEVLDSMKEFTEDLLGEEKTRAVLKDIVLERKEEKYDYELDSETSLKDLWSDFPKRVSLGEKPVKIFVLGSQFFPNKDELSWEFCFKKEEVELLKKMIQAMNIDENQVWTGACQGEDINLEPSLVEDIFHKELLQVKPKVLISFGAMATNFLMKAQKRLSSVQGEFFTYTVRNRGRISEFTYMPLFHPEYLLLNPNMKRKTWEGMKKIMARLEKIS